MKFVWTPLQKSLKLYVDDTEWVEKIVKGQNMELNYFGGEWTFGKHESKSVGTLDADIKDFYLFKSSRFVRAI